MEWDESKAAIEMMEGKILVNTYYNQDLKLPVLATDGKWKDVSGYKECYWSRDNFYFFHMPDDNATVAHIGLWSCEEPWYRDDSWENFIIVLSNSKYGIEEKRYRECLPINLDLRNMQVFFNGSEYIAFSHEGRVVIYNFHKGKYTEFNTGETISHYIHTDLPGYFITDEGYLSYREKCFKEIGKIKVKPSLNLRGTYFITESNDLYSESSLWNYAKGNYGLVKEVDKVINGFSGENYSAFHYKNGDVEILTTKEKQYSPLYLSGIKKAVFTESHIVFLHDDGTLSFNGKNKNRCCSKLDRFTNVVDIDGTDDSTTIVLKDEIITLP